MMRGARLAMIGVLCLLVSGGVMASDAAAATGDLTQKPGVAGCWSALGLCSPGSALGGARSVAVSPDGRSAYAASQGGSAVVVFDRAVDGTLTQRPGMAGCVSETGAGPCVDGAALDSARSVTVSPDGRSAYVASGSVGAVAVFDRAADGTLSQKAGAAACVSDGGAAPCVDGTALGGAFEVTVSADGRNAYVASYASGAVAVFDRAADGTLTQKAGTAACVSDAGAGPCGDGTALGGALGVVVSPDGKSAYVASFDSGAVAVFDRAADGTLTQKPGTLGCISASGAGPCVDGTALEGASSVTVSPDGQSVYVASQIGSAVAVFDRAADGTLTQKPGTAACISETGAGPCIDGTALDVAASVSVSPDGQSAYVASFDSDAVAVLDRGADGTLSQKPGTAGCISDTGRGPLRRRSGTRRPPLGDGQPRRCERLRRVGHQRRGRGVRSRAAATDADTDTDTDTTTAAAVGAAGEPRRARDPQHRGRRLHLRSGHLAQRRRDGRLHLQVVPAPPSAPDP